MAYYEEELDLTNNRIIELEKLLSIMQANQEYLLDQIKETQRYMLKLANNQAEITKRVTHWPYIAVSNED